MQQDSCPLIVGAGIAGLALGIALRDAGVPFVLAERRATPAAEGTGIVLTGNAVAALAELGLDAAVLAAGSPFAAIEFADAAGAALFTLDLGDQHAWGTWLCINRARLEDVLLAALEPTRVQWGKTLVELDETGSGVRAKWNDGSTTAHTVVIGADGVRSTVRSRRFGEHETRLRDFTGWRFVSRSDLALRRPLHLLGNGATFLLYPLPGGETYCGAGPVDAGNVQGDGPMDRMRNAFRDFGEPVQTALASLTADTDLHPTSYHSLQLQTWHTSRTVLIGDAAHACPPTLSLGAAMALEDARVLAERLTTAADPRQALTQFEQLRRPKVTRAQVAASERMLANRTVTPRSFALRTGLLRNLGAAQVAATWLTLASPSA